ncbi:hypothetical protein CLU79DRAFT_830896 [Phycomyces nitens]|nr:hypothetical protein CLU79DRAFT_830896 [Phycomyces nitens]
MEFDKTIFLATWLSMGAHWSHCQTIGYDLDKCPSRPRESRSCYRCPQVGYLCSSCSRAAEVDNSYKRERKTPVQHGPPIHTRPSVSTSKKPAGPSVVTKNRFEILGPSLSSAASKHNSANANIVSKDKKISNSPVEGIETGPTQLELPKRVGASIKHFDLSVVDMRDKEIIPEDDPDLTDHYMDEVNNHFETYIGEGSLFVHDIPHPLQ